MFNRQVNLIRLMIQALLSGMFLITGSCMEDPPGEKTASAPGSGSLHLSEAQVMIANIRTTDAREGSIGRKLSLTGILKVNEQSAVSISARIPGRIEKLYFRNTGETVRKGDKLYEFYSDNLVSAQREYFTLQSNNWNFSGRYEPSLALENKLLIMGMLPEQIAQLGKDGKIKFMVTIYSPVGGKIRSVKVSEGEYVSDGQPLYELAADNSLWAEAQVYPDDIRFLRTGMPVIVNVPSADVAPLLSSISFINPSFESGRNVTLVRAVIGNTESQLHPGMFAVLNVQTQTRRGIIIPLSSVISSGGGERVWIRQADGSFAAREVTTGIQSGDSVMILSGLEPSDQVVFSGAYLLNSELILKQGDGADEVQ